MNKSYLISEVCSGDYKWNVLTIVDGVYAGIGRFCKNLQEVVVYIENEEVPAIKEKIYLDSYIKNLDEYTEQIYNNEIDSGGYINEIKRIEGMVVFAYHFNIINAIEYSSYMDKLSDAIDKLYDN